MQCLRYHHHADEFGPLACKAICGPTEADELGVGGDDAIVDKVGFGRLEHTLWSAHGQIFADWGVWCDGLRSSNRSSSFVRAPELVQSSGAYSQLQRMHTVVYTRCFLPRIVAHVSHLKVDVCLSHCICSDTEGASIAILQTHVQAVEAVREVIENDPRR
jgi:hypothetical protein